MDDLSFSALSRFAYQLLDFRLECHFKNSTPGWTSRSNFLARNLFVLQATFNFLVAIAATTHRYKTLQLAADCLSEAIGDLNDVLRDDLTLICRKILE